MQSHRKHLIFLAALSPIFALLALIFPARVTAQEMVLPAPTGLYGVGTTSRHWIDDSRGETFTEDEADMRELMVQFWYPADVEAGAAPEPYLPNSDVILTLVNEGLTDEFAHSPTHSFLNAPISTRETSYPVLIFSPGYYAKPNYYQAQFEELASHGYIVAGISHTYTTPEVVFPDGRVVDSAYPQPASLERLWAADQVFVLNQLETEHVGEQEGFFTGRLNLEQVGVFGHSMGGLTAAQACLMDSRIRAGITEDGGVPGDALRDGIEQPFMLMRVGSSAGSNDLVFQRLLGPAYNLAFNGFQHNSFGDFPLWPDNDGLFLTPDSGDMVDGLRTVQMTNAYILAFFNKHLKGEDEPLLDDTSPDFPEVQFQARNT